MSELKDYKVYTTINGGAYGYHYEPNPNKDSSDIKLNDKQVYLKKDVDKVIAEKDKELRHHKYKRCLDKAKWCEERISRYTLQQDIQGISWQKEIKFYRRLQNKFIEISKQFKEAIK